MNINILGSIKSFKKLHAIEYPWSLRHIETWILRSGPHSRGPKIRLEMVKDQIMLEPCSLSRETPSKRSRHSTSTMVMERGYIHYYPLYIHYYESCNCISFERDLPSFTNSESLINIWVSIHHTISCSQPPTHATECGY